MYLYKPLLHLLLPAWLPKVLVLDTDVLAGRDLSRLWRRGFESFGPSQLLMAKLHQVGDLWRPYGGQKACERLRETTINSGVMLLDLGLMRRTRWVAHVLSQLSSDRASAQHCALVRNGTLCSGDQLVLSAACGARLACTSIPQSSPAMPRRTPRGTPHRARADWCWSRQLLTCDAGPATSARCPSMP